MSVHHRNLRSAIRTAHCLACQQEGGTGHNKLAKHEQPVCSPQGIQKRSFLSTIAFSKRFWPCWTFCNRLVFYALLRLCQDTNHLVLIKFQENWSSQETAKRHTLRSINLLTLRLLMSYIYMELLVKPKMLTSYIYGPTSGNAETVSFYLLHNVSTLNQCREVSCVTFVCKHFAS